MVKIELRTNCWKVVLEVEKITTLYLLTMVFRPFSTVLIKLE